MKATDLKKLSEPLSITDIDFRVQSVTKTNKAIILAYKDARVDMRVLDDVCGGEWQSKYHRDSKGVLFCSIGIKVDDEWIWRESNGVESNQDEVKGEASDAFKRAGFMWGIGRELYDFPLTMIPLRENEIHKYTNKQNKEITTTKNFYPDSWDWSGEYDKKAKIYKNLKALHKGVDRLNGKKEDPPKDGKLDNELDVIEKFQKVKTNKEGRIV